MNFCILYLKSSGRSGKSISSRDSPHDGGRGSNGGTIAISSSEDAARGGDSGGDEAEESKLKENSFTEKLNSSQHLSLHSPGPS